MASCAISSSTTCREPADINFDFQEEKGLCVTVDTENLHMRSTEASEDEYERYALLFGDKEVVEKFATGKTKKKEEIERCIRHVWAQRWHDKDPYSGLAVFKNDSEEFLGHVVIGYGDAPGEGELAFLFHRAHWGKGYGSEAVTAVVRDYAPSTVRAGFTLEGKPLETLVATARPDNPASIKILEKVGMHCVKREEKYGALRHHYALSMREL